MKKNDTVRPLSKKKECGMEESNISITIEIGGVTEGGNSCHRTCYDKKGGLLFNRGYNLRSRKKYLTPCKKKKRGARDRGGK